MALSKEELLKPRYKVIAGYPTSHLYFDIGDILEWDGSYYKRKENISMAKETVESYPHLFKKLEWWEERAAEDMPQYIKHKSTNEIAGFGNQSKITPSDVLTSIGWLNLHDCLPSDQIEYNSQK